MFEYAKLSERCELDSVCARHGSSRILFSIKFCICYNGFTGPCCETSMYLNSITKHFWKTQMHEINVCLSLIRHKTNTCQKY